MRAIVFCLISVLLVSFAKAQVDGNVKIWMPNASSCAKILPLETVQKQYRLTEEDAKKIRDYGMVLGWIQGYITATNMYNPKADGDVASNLSAGDWMNWLFNYCRHSPTAAYVDILNALNKAMKLNSSRK